MLLQSDLDIFFKKFDTQQVGHKPTLISIAGGHLNASETDPENLGEATMDFQLVMGLLGRTQDVLLYQVGKDNSDPDPGTYTHIFVVNVRLLTESYVCM